MSGALAVFARGGATKGKVAAAFHEVSANEPSVVGKTRAKFGAERAEKQRVAIALSKARAAGARIPRKMDGGALATYADGGAVKPQQYQLVSNLHGRIATGTKQELLDLARRQGIQIGGAAARGTGYFLKPIEIGYQDGGPVEFSAGRADFVPQWRDPSIGFQPKDLLFAGARAGGLRPAGLRGLIKQIARQRAAKEAALLAVDPVERLFAEAARKVPGFADGGLMRAAGFQSVTSPRAPAQEPELRAMTARLRRPVARPAVDPDAQIRAVLAEIVGEEEGA